MLVFFVCQIHAQPPTNVKKVDMSVITNSMTYKLYQWLQTEDGKAVIKESGYIPN
ncbi:MAG: hypothetical protein LBR36_02360 [Bacteroidales bacterium]|nr:hypothetical protein [Bacteroidales bacterium]